MSELFLVFLEGVREQGAGYCHDMMNELSAPLSPNEPAALLLVGNQHALYREVLASALLSLRPNLGVRAVAPGELDAAIDHLHPRMVICSELSKHIQDSVQFWILLHPDERLHSTVSVCGKRSEIPHPPLPDLVQIIDDLWSLPLVCTHVPPV